jgi:predicted membrane protein
LRQISEHVKELMGTGMNIVVVVGERARKILERSLFSPLPASFLPTHPHHEDIFLNGFSSRS